MRISRYETYRRIIECCQSGHKTVHQMHQYVNRGVPAKDRQSECSVSARRRDDRIRDLIDTEIKSGVGYYIAKSGAMAELNRRYGVKRSAA